MTLSNLTAEEQKKLKMIGSATRKFMGAAGRLVDAANARAQYEAGSRGLARANERYAKVDAKYEKAYAALDAVIDDLG
jgi:hypothetical protein